MWYVYVLESEKDEYKYVGMTDDLKKRLDLHNSSKVLSTKPRVPFKVIYYEAHIDKHDAAARERFLKSGWGKNWIAKTLRNYIKKFGGQAADRRENCNP